MPVRRTSDGRWRYRHVVHKPDGTRERINGSAPEYINTKVAAERAMLDHIERVMHPERVPTKREVPTFSEWFKGRFWKEWVVGRMNKPTEVRSKNIAAGTPSQQAAFSAGVGVRWNIPRRMSIGIDAAHVLDGTTTTSSGDRRIHASLVFRF